MSQPVRFRRRTRGRLVAALVAGASLAVQLVAWSQASAQQSPSVESAVPIRAAQIDAAVAQLDAIAVGVMRRTGVPGIAIAVVDDDKVVYAKGFGVRKVGSPGRVDANTVFQLASVSKPLGATAIARSDGLGRVRWNDPIVKYLPASPCRIRSPHGR